SCLRGCICASQTRRETSIYPRGEPVEPRAQYSAIVLALRRNRRPAYDSRAFLDRDRLIRVERADVVDTSAGARDAQAGDPRRCGEPESQRQLALREVARSRLYDLPEAGSTANGDLDARPDAVAIRGGPDRHHAQHVVPVAAVVSKEARRPVIGRDHHVQVAV